MIAWHKYSELVLKVVWEVAAALCTRCIAGSLILQLSLRHAILTGSQTPGNVSTEDCSWLLEHLA